ncbi:MAG: hypothetical protein SVY10_03335 [Thermodesulfobacteriota bacterium]|nr:hypothetical protein [Thermodesulfobacteriota bacterium]
MVQRPAITSFGEMKEKYDLPLIPDMFLIDERGQGRSFRDSMKDESYREYDKKYYQAHNAFFEDLEMERFFREYLKIDELGNPKNQTIYELLFFLPTDIHTVKFRQDILKDFIADEELSQLIEDAKNRLGKRLSEINFSATRRGLLLPFSRLLDAYEDVLAELMEKFGSKESGGLNELSCFLGEMRDHPDIQIWKEYDKKIEEEEPFFLALTRRYDFTPIGFSVFGFENNTHEFAEMLEKATNRFGKINTDSIDGDRLETVEVSLSSRHNRIRIPVMDAFVQIMMQVFGNPFDGLEDHVRYTIAALKQLQFYQKVSDLFSRLTERSIPCVFPKINVTELREMMAEDVYNFVIEREQGKELVPNDIRNDDARRINIITGSNFCGKSWYMKTVGLVQLMGQVGLFVPRD